MAQTERIDGLEHSFRVHEMATGTRLNDLEALTRRKCGPLVWTASSC